MTSRQKQKLTLNGIVALPVGFDYICRTSKIFLMKSIIININNDNLAEKVIGLLEFLQNEGLEIVSKEDMEDLKLLKSTRNEESVPFEDYLEDEHQDS